MSVFTMKLEPELRDEFMAATEAAHRPASQVVRELMREYIQQRRSELEYDDFLRRKVEIARGQIAKGQYRSNDEVEARFAPCARNFDAKPAKLRHEGSLGHGRRTRPRRHHR